MTGFKKEKGNVSFCRVLAKFRPQEDFKVRTFSVTGTEATLCYFDSLTDGEKLGRLVLQPLLQLQKYAFSAEQLTKELLYLPNVQSLATNACAETERTMQEELLSGHALLCYRDEVLSLDVRMAGGRTVAEPPTSGVNKGPREGFVESCKTNLMLLRKRLKTPGFCVKSKTVGRLTQTSVQICYIKGVAKAEIVRRVEKELDKIDIDGILDSSYLSNYLDGGSTLFKMVGTTEKPDIAVAKMLEGRICLLVDGSPIALTVPYLFVEDLQSPDDYYDTAETATVARLLRLLAVFGSVMLPGLFVSLEMYNYQIIPTKFLITIMSATEGLPFSQITEMLLVLVLFDILREASARMPQFAGVTLSIVGAIVLGDAAVKAGLLGAPSVMIGALSGIGLYTMPDNTLILSLLRLAITIAGGVMGVFGVLLLSLFLLCYAVSLQRYDTPYLAPFAPAVSADWKDAVRKKRLTQMRYRPYSLPNEDRRRLRLLSKESADAEQKGEKKP